MPYALSNLVEGEIPSARYIAAASDAAAEEVVLADAHYESKQGWVWDATNKTLRQANDVDRLKSAKRDATRRLETTAVSDMQVILHVYRALTVLARNSSDPRLDKIKAKDDTLTTRLQEVSSASTLAEIETALAKGV